MSTRNSVNPRNNSILMPSLYDINMASEDASMCSQFWIFMSVDLNGGVSHLGVMNTDGFNFPVFTCSSRNYLRIKGGYS